MIKKIIISSMALFGMSLATLYKVDSMEVLPSASKEVENTVNAPIVVLELFTSQGCSSCPPADRLLDKVKSQFPDKVFALSYHVDYWNYIGWNDPFSKSGYSKKQGEYNIKFKNRSNYTPQLVVNGMEHFVGSNSSKLYASINTYSQENPANKIQLNNVQKASSEIKFDYTLTGNLEGRKIRIILVLDERTTQVKRGENRNRSLKNSNIVVAEKYLMFPEKNGSAHIPIPSIVSANDKIMLMALVETENLDIVGATKKALR
ncbi:DUF1223 domain-containing protein [Flagellimonas algicola]|uniref:DUF1223 domain-containing protein n=1 Tax=Flagellimonas algicola TaxID=2583815 RepID=A0ABY2WN22_9FLAO|nr:DUF1223 domain-containing protein [Allomuricauda algicola]TMU56165.1 DUF1223 domain-containing protein [Allomuricauda algicola]